MRILISSHPGNQLVRNQCGDESRVPKGGLKIASIEKRDRAGLKITTLECERRLTVRLNLEPHARIG